MAIALLGFVIAGAVDADPDAPPATAADSAPAPVQVTVAPSAPMAPIPRSYLGLSTEYWALPLWSDAMPMLERAMSLLRVPGDGPLVLRIGGDSADHSFWAPSPGPTPAWAYAIRPSWLSQAGALARQLHLKLILDLNLITDSPAAAARWASAAEAALPRGSIAGFEIGNEPDIYSRADWIELTEQRRLTGRLTSPPRLPAAVTAAGYAADFRAYAAALATVAPGTILAGPALANPVHHRRWIETLLTRAGGSLRMITIHRYPLSGCASRLHTPGYATVRRILSPATASGMAAPLAAIIAHAHAAGLPVRMTELNSVNCGGVPGVSDTFATALWAPDALFSLLHVGLDGVNIHVRAEAINAPFALGPWGLGARPLLYGLVLFTRALGPNPRLVALRTRHARNVNVSAWAVRVGPRTLHVLVIDKSRRAIRVSLRLPAQSGATVQRMLAPSVHSGSGVTLGGQRLARNGRWQGAAVRERVTRRRGRYMITLTRFSAALLSVPVTSGALGAPSAPRSGPRPETDRLTGDRHRLGRAHEHDHRQATAAPAPGLGSPRRASPAARRASPARPVRR